MASHYSDCLLEMIKVFLSRIGAEQLPGANRIYEAIELSLFSYSQDPNVFKALLEKWSPSTNTFHTFYGEFGISLVDLQKIGGLPLSGEFYDECNPSNEILGSNLIPQATLDLYSLLRALSAKPTFQAWINNFIIRIPHHLNSNTVDLEEIEDFPFEYRRDYSRNTILAAFLAYWLSRFPLSSARSETIRSETFLMLAIYIPRTYSCKDLSYPNAPLLSLIRDSPPTRFNYYTAPKLFRNSIKFSFAHIAGDNLKVEPYEPSHFGRQFGYGQHCPKDVDTRCRDNCDSVTIFYPQVSKKVTNNPTSKKTSAKKHLLEPTENEVDDLFLSKFYEHLDRFTKDLSVDYIRSDKTIDPRQSEGMRSSLVEDGLIHSVEFPTDKSSSQNSPTTFAKKRLLEPTEKEVDDLFLSKFYERLDRFTKDLSVDYIESGKTIDPRQSEGMHTSLVEDELIHSVEFPIDESSSQNGPTTFGSLDDLESYMSSLPSTKDIYNLFANGVFVKGSDFLWTKRTKKVKRFPSCGIRDEPRPSTLLGDLSPTNKNLVRGKEVVFESVDKISSKDKEIFHLEDETNNELFDYTPLNARSLDSVSAQQG
ncbi:hypothetical protein ACH5RR_018160 [Cinchona calisaya]|uniref:Aminotransferase-like plant mobile domain-containing protein n=1 Tax=Cinchona calisaya TaxID=153742 RepID=A0ABD2ZKM9_9GENT